jgi:ABC-type Fe3+-hydroxamate transport system substrate-binding protein
MKHVRLMRWLTLLTLCAVLAGLGTACSGGGGAAPTTQATAAVSLGSIQMNAHPASLEGKTVVLRWNGKTNGDKLLNAVGDLLTQNVKDVKIVKLWETNPETATSSESAEKSAQFADTVAALNPDLVIGSQCD